MHDDDPDPSEELAEPLAEAELDEDEAELSEQDENAHVLSIRRGDGEELMTVVSLGEPWAVHMQPGGRIGNAYIGEQRTPTVWVNTWDQRIEREEDGTYVIRID